MPPIPDKSTHYQKPVQTLTYAGTIPTATEFSVFKAVMEEEPFTTPAEKAIFDMGKIEGMDQKRAEIIAMVMNLLKENPNIDGLEILKKL